MRIEEIDSERQHWREPYQQSLKPIVVGTRLNDIHSEKSISFTQAELGGEAEVETVHGTETLRITPGIQPDHVFRLRGKGVPFLDGNGKGDHYVHVKMRVPTSLSEPQRTLLEQLAKLEVEEPPEQKGVLDKVKEFFGGE